MTEDFFYLLKTDEGRSALAKAMTQHLRQNKIACKFCGREGDIGTCEGCGAQIKSSAGIVTPSMPSIPPAGITNE